MSAGAEEQARPLAPQVEADVRVAHEGKEPGVLFQRRVGSGDEVLVLERRDRNVLPGEARDIGTVESGRVDDGFADDRSPAGPDLPFPAPGSLQAGDTGEPNDLRPARPRRCRQRVGELARIDVALVGVVEPAQDRVVGAPPGMHRLHLAGRHHGQLEAGGHRDPDEVTEEVHPVASMGRPERAGMPVRDGMSDLLRQILVEPPRVVAGPHAEPGVGEGGDVARGVPGRARGQLVLLNQHAVADACPRQVPETGGADRTASDDDDARAPGRPGPRPLIGSCFVAAICELD